MVSVRETLALAVQQHQAGKLQQAENLYLQILQVEPQNVDALHLLGLVENQTGRTQAAIEHMIASLRLRPNQAEANNNLGVAFQSRGQLAEATACFRQAAYLKPDYPEAHNNLGNVLRLQGKYQEAVPSLQQAIRLNPRYANAFTCLGLVLQKLGRPTESLSFYEQALAINPGSAEVFNHIGSALIELNRHAEAIPYLQSALGIRPNLASAHDQLGVALGAVGRHVEAVACHQRAIDLDPTLADAHFHLGHLLRTQGRIEESRGAFERAIALAPRRTDYFFNLAESHRFKPDDPLLATMEALGKQPISIPERIFLHFGLGKAYADLDRHEDAFRHLAEGNRLHRQRIKYHEAATLKVFERVATVFTPELLRSKAGLGDPSALPIFIVGMPRSGSTLLEQVLSSHPKVFGAGELTTFVKAASKLDGLDAPALEPFRAAIEALTSEQLRSVAAQYIHQMQALAPNAERIVDKALGNFIIVGLIHVVLPNARILHIHRDPIDTCVSCYSKWFGTEQQHTFDLAELGRYYRGYDELMAHWRRVLPSGVMLEVQYEDLVEDLEPQARRIIAHCGLDWDQRCLDFHKTDRPIKTASAAQVRQPIYRSSIGRWRAWKGFLQPLFDALGPLADAPK